MKLFFYVMILCTLISGCATTPSWNRTLSPQERTPELSVKYSDLAARFISKGRYGNAIKAGMKAIECNASNAVAYYNIALAYRRKGNHQEALNFYGQAITHDSQYVNAYINMGVLYCLMDENEAAVEVLNKALQVDPEAAAAYANLGFAHKNMDQREEAIENLSRALQLFRAQGRRHDIAHTKYLLAKLKETPPSPKKEIAKSKFLDIAAVDFSYREQTGSDVITSSWHIERKDSSFLLTSQRGNERYTSLYDGALRVKEWDFKNTAQDTAFQAKREGNTIAIKGRLEGKAVDKKIKLDSNPWYQPMSFCLGGLLDSNTQSVVFWTLNPKDLTPAKMKAVNRGLVALKEDKGERDAYLVTVRFVGVRSLAWQGRYWFDEGNKLFIRYEGVDGPPGTPKTVIMRIEESEEVENAERGASR